jgi:holin-like protein
MIEAMAALLLCQLAGEALVRLTGTTVPGPVLGMGLLLIVLLVRARLRPASADLQGTPLASVTSLLLAHLSLLFVPAGAGIIAQLGALFQHGVGLIVALVVSTALSLVVAAQTFAFVSRWMDKGEVADDT